ncbi:MAG: hypothetical protein WC505_05190 [Patescibacteria group bacterium]
MDPKTKAHQEALNRFRAGQYPEPDVNPDKDPNGGWPTRRGKGVSSIARNIGNGNHIPPRVDGFGVQC